jgi:hypothetical protein
VAHATRDDGGFIPLRVDGVDDVVRRARHRIAAAQPEDRLDVVSGDEVVHDADDALGVDVRDARGHDVRLGRADG